MISRWVFIVFHGLVFRWLRPQDEVINYEVDSSHPPKHETWDKMKWLVTMLFFDIGVWTISAFYMSFGEFIGVWHGRGLHFHFYRSVRIVVFFHHVLPLSEEVVGFPKATFMTGPLKGHVFFVSSSFVHDWSGREFW